MARLIERLLNLQRGDLARGSLLFSYLFLIIASYVVGKAARSALFLGKYDAVKLPYATIAIAILVGFVIAGYVRIRRRTGLRNLLIGSLIFFSLNAVVFWYLAHYYDLPWLYPIFYIWVGIYGVLAPAQVWTLANYVLTTRDAKRVFTLVGSGAITGWIFGGFMTSVLVKRFGTESVLLGMAALLAPCVVVVMLICRQRGPHGTDVQEFSESAQGQPGFLESLKLVGSSTYLRAIAAVICLSSVATTVAGWQLEAFVQKFYEGHTDAMGSFLGNFNFFAGIASLIVQISLTSRVLRRFGIGPALFAVPVALLMGSGAVLVFGTLAAAVFLKGSDQVLRYSLDKSSVELLYLPVSPSIKLQIKSFIDTAVWRFGDGLAGVAVLLFATWGGISPRHVSWVNVAFIGGWLVAALVARRKYVATLRESILQHRLDAERASAPVLDRSATDLLADRLTATDPKEILYALGLFQMGHQQAAHPAVRGLLSHPAHEVRQKAVSILSDAGDTGVRPQIEALLQDPHLEVRTEALLYLARHAHVDPLTCIESLGNFPDFSVRSAVVAFLARPGEAQNVEVARIMLEAMAQEEGPEGKRTRLEAARLLATLPDHFEQPLQHLLSDEDPEIALEAIRAAAKHPKRRFVPLLLERLKDPQFAGEVADALARYGEAIVPALHDHLTNPEFPIEARREIPAVLARMGCQASARVLNECVLDSDTQLRFRVISALNKLCQSHPEIECDRQMLETVLAAEILGHYRSYQILGTLGDGVRESDDPVARALRESMRQEIERIFRLLSLLHPGVDLHSAYYGVQSENPIVHDNALEFLDNVLQPHLRKVLVPLVDSTVTVAERVRLAGLVVGTDMGSREQAVAALVRSDDPWLKSCGAYAVGTLGLRSLEPEIDRCLEHPDPLLRETARQAKLRLAALAATS